MECFENGTVALEGNAKIHRIPLLSQNAEPNLSDPKLPMNQFARELMPNRLEQVPLQSHLSDLQQLNIEFLSWQWWINNDDAALVLMGPRMPGF